MAAERRPGAVGVVPAGDPSSGVPAERDAPCPVGPRLPGTTATALAEPQGDDPVAAESRHGIFGMNVVGEKLPAALQRLVDLVEAPKFSIASYHAMMWKARAQGWTEGSRAWMQAKLDGARGRIAVMLPAGEVLQLLHVRVIARATVDFGDSPRRLYICELSSTKTGFPVHVQLELLRQLVERATRLRRPSSGPWMWPLHNDSVSLALLGANTILTEERVPCWRRVLWALRMFPLPSGCHKERLLQRTYGSAVSYVFAWTNIYVQGLWCLALLVVVCTWAGVQPGNTGSKDGYGWNVLQFLVLLWAALLTMKAHSKRQVEIAGGVRESTLALRSTASIFNGLGWRRAVGRTRSTESREEANPNANADMTPLTPIAADRPRTGNYFDEDLRRDRDHALARSKLHAKRALTSAMGSRIAGERWRSAVRAAKLSVMPAALEKQRNFKWVKMSPRALRCRRVMAVIFGVLVITAFVSFCVVILAAFVQLNMFLAFIWGECLTDEVRKRAQADGQMCRDPEVVHGFVGWLAEVGSDVSLAILFDVTLGAAAQALAKFLVGLWNYKFYHDRREKETMLSMLVEVLSKVGMFAVVGFVFLPRWNPELPGPFVAAERCAKNFDYRMCRAALQCDVAINPECCSGTLMCIAQQLDFEDRKYLFAKSVKGPFMVAPFVRILLTVLVPWLAGWLESTITIDSRDVETGAAEASVAEAERRRTGGCLHCLRVFFTPLFRILALIFHLDGDGVGGIRYLVRGWPFRHFEPLGTNAKEPKTANALRKSMNEVTLKLFEPIDELCDLKLSFLFVVFFAPLMPLGVLPTLAARLVEVRFKATKVFFVRQRCWPEGNNLLHVTQDAFSQSATALAVFWHTGLVLVSFNEYIGDEKIWPWYRVGGIWLAASLCVLVVLRVVCFIVQALERFIFTRSSAVESRRHVGKACRKGGASIADRMRADDAGDLLTQETQTKAQV